MPKEEIIDQPSNGDSHDHGSEDETDQRWKISKSGLLVFVTICVLTLMVALDSTSIGVVLSVSLTL